MSRGGGRGRMECDDGYGGWRYPVQRLSNWTIGLGVGLGTIGMQVVALQGWGFISGDDGMGLSSCSFYLPVCLDP